MEEVFLGDLTGPTRNMLAWTYAIVLKEISLSPSLFKSACYLVRSNQHYRFKAEFDYADREWFKVFPSK